MSASVSLCLCLCLFCLCLSLSPCLHICFSHLSVPLSFCVFHVHVCVSSVSVFYVSLLVSLYLCFFVSVHMCLSSSVCLLALHTHIHAHTYIICMPRSLSECLCIWCDVSSSTSLSTSFSEQEPASEPQLALSWLGCLVSRMLGFFCLYSRPATSSTEVSGVHSQAQFYVSFGKRLRPSCLCSKYPQQVIISAP